MADIDLPVKNEIVNIQEAKGIEITLRLEKIPTIPNMPYIQSMPYPGVEETEDLT